MCLWLKSDLDALDFVVLDSVRGGQDRLCDKGHGRTRRHARVPLTVLIQISYCPLFVLVRVGHDTRLIGKKRVIMKR